jgi:hypothetical protein
MVRKIKRQQAAMSDRPRGEPPHDLSTHEPQHARTWTEYAADVIGHALDSASQAMKWPGVGVGVAAASTDPGSCDANGVCGSGKPADERSTVGELVADAGQRFKVTLSKGAQRDPAQSLQGCTVLLGDSDHIDETVQNDLRTIADRHFASGDRWLTEERQDLLAGFAKAKQDEVCRGIALASALGEPGCSGIEDASLSQKSAAAMQGFAKALRAMLALVQSAVPEQCKLSQPLDTMDPMEIMATYYEVLPQVNTHALTDRQWEKLVKLTADADARQTALSEALRSEEGGRNGHFAQMTARYADASYTTWFDVGRKHTTPVMHSIDDGERCIVKLDHV